MSRLSYTIKIHILETHIPKIMKRTGKTLSEENDEHVEAAHYTLKKMEETHGYKINTFGPLQGTQQNNLIVHFNSNNI